MTVTEEPRVSAGEIAERLTVLVGAAVATVGAAWGSGAFGGTPIEEAADGAFAADATLLAPATPAFAVWSVIYAGLAVFAIVQATPRWGREPRIRAAAWPMLAAMILNAVWIGVVQQGWVVGSVAALAGIVAALGFAVARIAPHRPASVVEALALDVPAGLYLGWATVATVANITAAAAWYFGIEPGAGMPAAVGVVAAVALLGIAIARDLGSSPVLAWATTATFAWGLAWIGLGRLDGEPAEPIVGYAALAAAGLVVLATLVTTVLAAVRGLRARMRAES